MSVDRLDDLSNYTAMTTDDWTFIREQAAAFGVTDAALYKWRQRGVPHRYRLPLVEAAQAAGRDVPQFEPPANADREAA